MDIVYYIVQWEIRWDQLAYLAYGSIEYMADLLEANQSVACFDWIPIGTIMQCPVILDAAINPLPTNALPAWKQ